MRARLFCEPQQGATYDTILALARAAEDGGFDAFFRSDHYQGGPNLAAPGSTDAWVTLAGLARETSRIRLGTLVSPMTFRYPGVMAVTVAQVDAMSGGRVEMGLGTGWNHVEHKSFAIPFPEPIGVRFAQLEEQLEIITGLWATPTGERYSFAGTHYTVEDSPALPKPVQSPLPIVIGGGGPKRTPTIAVRFGHEYNCAFAPVDVVRERFATLDRICDEHGRDPGTLRRSVALTTVCGADEAEIEKRAAAVKAPVAALRENALCGTPQEVLDKVGRYAELGADTFYFQTLDMADLDMVRLLAEQVLPHLP